MSRVGKQPIKILSGVKVNLSGTTLKVEGPKGKLERDLSDGVDVKIDGDTITVDVVKGRKDSPALRGLTRTLINNMVVGTHTGFTRSLEIQGVGYRAAVKGKNLSLTLGLSHPVDFPIPDGIEAKVEANTKIHLSGADKENLGVVAAKIRSFRKPEPYQGKGVRYSDEHIVRKVGKAAGAK